MSVYTTQVRWIIESGKTLALSSYPIFDTSYRAKLNQKIIDHFYFREIGFETVGLFNNRLAAKMNEIMPYYNQLYKSALLNISPLINRMYTETYAGEGKDKGTSEGSDTRKGTDTKSTISNMSGNGSKSDQENRSGTAQSSGSQDSKSVGSDTPQGLLEAENINSDLWASQAQIGSGSEQAQSESQETLIVRESTTTEQEGKSNETDLRQEDGSHSESRTTDKWETFTRSLQGLEGTSQARLLQEFRETFLNIDMLIIRDLEELFMNIY